MEIGSKYIVEKTVAISDTAYSYGSGLLEVFATPAMIALMEQSAHLCAKEQLDNGLDTVGIEVNIQHLKATPVGGLVSAESELVAIDGKKLTFNVIAKDKNGIIGQGTHVRFIIDPIKFINKLS